MLDQGSALGDISHADNASDWNATRMRWFVVGIGNTGEVGLVVASIVIEVGEDGIVVRERLRRRVVVRHREGGWRAGTDLEATQSVPYIKLSRTRDLRVNPIPFSNLEITESSVHRCGVFKGPRAPNELSIHQRRMHPPCPTQLC